MAFSLKNLSKTKKERKKERGVTLCSSHGNGIHKYYSGTVKKKKTLSSFGGINLIFLLKINGFICFVFFCS